MNRRAPWMGLALAAILCGGCWTVQKSAPAAKPIIIEGNDLTEWNGCISNLDLRPPNPQPVCTTPAP